MKKIFLLLEIVLLSLLLSGCNNDGISESVDLGLIKSEGRWMVDDGGRVLMIHGVNQVNKLPPHYDAASLGFDQEDAELLRHYGFNAVRLGVMWAAVEPNRGQYDKAYLESIRQTVKLLKEYGIYSLLDFHQDAFSIKHGGSGFPLWAALGEGRTSDMPFPGPYFDPFHTGAAKDFNQFWNNQDSIQDSYMYMLTLVVNTLGSENGVLGVEFINEPFPGTTWTDCGTIGPDLKDINFSNGCQEFDSGHLTDFYNKAIQHVRDINSDIMVVYDANTLGGIGAPPHIGVIEDDNALFSWHNYWSPDYASLFRYAEDYQKLSGSGILMTEFGASVKIDDWSEVLSLSDSNLMSWMFWAYSNNPPYKIKEVNGIKADGRQQGLVYDLSQPMDANLTDANTSRDVNLDVPRIEALSRPYPQWTAGIPQELDYNTTTNILTFKWSFKDYQGKNAKSELFVPEHSYPNGYRVTTKNCRIISGPPNNTKLVVSNTNSGDNFDGEIIIMPIVK